MEVGSGMQVVPDRISYLGEKRKINLMIIVEIWLFFAIEKKKR